MIVTTLPNLHITPSAVRVRRKAEFTMKNRKQYENKYLRNEGYAVEPSGTVCRI